MKLKELLNEMLKYDPELPERDYFGMKEVVYGEALIPYVDQLRECDEFKDCELIILERPWVERGIGDPLQALTMKINDTTKFRRKCYLLSLCFTPRVYSHTELLTPVKDGVNISPTLYDPLTYVPYNNISLRFSLGRAQDDLDEHRKELHQMLDNVLDNPNEYMVKGTKEVMVRGLFEEYETDGEVHTKDLIGVQNPPYANHFMAFYANYVPEGDNLFKLELRQKLIPNRFKDKFSEKFSGLSLNETREVDIDKFLAEND